METNRPSSEHGAIYQASEEQLYGWIVEGWPPDMSVITIIQTAVNNGIRFGVSDLIRILMGVEGRLSNSEEK